MTRASWILHADMDAFYASIEQRDDPTLRGKPVIVGATSARGVVAAASYEARVFGVRSAMPGFQARELCPNGVYLPSDMEKYGRVSDQVHRVFAEFTPDIEPLALDEAFLDISGSTALFGDPQAIGRQLKCRVREETGLCVSVGIAPTKLVAKIACTLSKPDGLIVVPPEAVRWLLDPLPVRRLWGVGPVMERRLVDLGIHTIGDLARFDVAALQAAAGDLAASLIRLARGDDVRSVEAEQQARSCGEEGTFERDVHSRDDVTAALTAHAEAVARRLRHQALSGRTVTVKIKLARRRGSRASRVGSRGGEPIYPLLTRSRTLGRATDDGKLIRAIAIQLWDAAKIAEPVRLLGVSLSGLEPRQPDAEQLDLFAGRPKDERLGPALDAITARFGKHAIGRAVADPGKLTPSDRRKRGE